MKWRCRCGHGWAALIVRVYHTAAAQVSDDDDGGGSFGEGGDGGAEWARVGSDEEEEVDPDAAIFAAADDDEQLFEDYETIQGRKEWVKLGLPVKEYTLLKLQQRKFNENRFKDAEERREKEARAAIAIEDVRSRVVRDEETRRYCREHHGMRVEEDLMRELMVRGAEIDTIIAGGLITEKLVRRELIKNSVVTRNALTQERKAMVAEDERSQAVQVLWRDEHNERRELHQMRHEEWLRRDADKQLKFGFRRLSRLSAASGGVWDDTSSDSDPEMGDLSDGSLDEGYDSEEEDRQAMM